MFPRLLLSALIGLGACDQLVPYRPASDAASSGQLDVGGDGPAGPQPEVGLDAQLEASIHDVAFVDAWIGDVSVDGRADLPLYDIPRDGQTSDVTAGGDVALDGVAVGDVAVGDVAPDVQPSDTVSLPPRIIISEMMIDPEKKDDATGEWFELYNAESYAVNIQGWTITDNSGSHPIGDSIAISPGQYITLAKSKNAQAGELYVYTSNVYFSNDADVLQIWDGSTLIDEVSYDGSWPYQTGASMSVDVTKPNDLSANWCTEMVPYASGDNGTPGAKRQCNP